MAHTITDKQIRSLVDTLVADLTELVHKEALRLVQDAMTAAPSATSPPPSG